MQLGQGSASTAALLALALGRCTCVTSHALELLEARRATLLESTKLKFAAGLIFPGPITTDKPADLRKPWAAAMEEASLKDFRSHDLRHTTAHYLAMDGTSLLSISKVLGHKSTKMTERYAHLTSSHLDEAIRSMNEKRFGARQPRMTKRPPARPRLCLIPRAKVMTTVPCRCHKSTATRNRWGRHVFWHQDTTTSLCRWQAAMLESLKPGNVKKHYFLYLFMNNQPYAG
jgi:hypothetical protein